MTLAPVEWPGDYWGARPTSTGPPATDRASRYYPAPVPRGATIGPGPLCGYRRHLTTSQRAMVAEKLATMQRGGDRKSDQAANLPNDLVTQEQAAAMLTVSPRSVRESTPPAPPLPVK